MSPQFPRPIDPSLHPLVTGNYRLATPAIEALYELVTRCLRYRIPGALILWTTAHWQDPRDRVNRPFSVPRQSRISWGHCRAVSFTLP